MENNKREHPYIIANNDKVISDFLDTFSFDTEDVSGSSDVFDTEEYNEWKAKSQEMTIMYRFLLNVLYASIFDGESLIKALPGNE